MFAFRNATARQRLEMCENLKARKQPSTSSPSTAFSKHVERSSLGRESKPHGSSRGSFRRDFEGWPSRLPSDRRTSESSDMVEISRRLLSRTDAQKKMEERTKRSKGKESRRTKDAGRERLGLCLTRAIEVRFEVDELCPCPFRNSSLFFKNLAEYERSEGRARDNDGHGWTSARLYRDPNAVERKIQISTSSCTPLASRPTSFSAVNSSFKIYKIVRMSFQRTPSLSRAFASRLFDFDALSANNTHVFPNLRLIPSI